MIVAGEETLSSQLTVLMHKEALTVCFCLWTRLPSKPVQGLLGSCDRSKQVVVGVCYLSADNYLAI